MISVLFVMFYLIGLTVQKERFIMKLENFQNMQYYGKVLVGEEKKELNLVLSTTSSLTWIKPDKLNNNKIDEKMIDYNVIKSLIRLLME